MQHVRDVLEWWTDAQAQVQAQKVRRSPTESLFNLSVRDGLVTETIDWRSWDCIECVGAVHLVGGECVRGRGWGNSLTTLRVLTLRLTLSLTSSAHLE